MYLLPPARGIAILTLAAALAGAGCGVEPDPAPRAQSAPVPQAAGPRSSEPQVPLSAPVPFTTPPAAYTGELPPFPILPSPAPRPPEVIRAAFTFAARHPEVLHYVPCFCGCEHAGHSDNDDCFIKSRDANGRPTWEPHGMT